MGNGIMGIPLLGLMLYFFGVIVFHGLSELLSQPPFSYAVAWYLAGLILIALPLAGVQYVWNLFYNPPLTHYIHLNIILGLFAVIFYLAVSYKVFLILPRAFARKYPEIFLGIVKIYLITPLIFLVAYGVYLILIWSLEWLLVTR